MPDRTTTEAAGDALRQFGIRQGEPVALGGGISTDAWKVNGTDRAFVLRRHDGRRHAWPQVVSELVWLDALGRDAAAQRRSRFGRRTGH